MSGGPTFRLASFDVTMMSTSIGHTPMEVKVQPSMCRGKRPPVLHRAARRLFWLAIADSRSTEETAQIAGASQAVGARWFRECGGMPPSHLSPSSPQTTDRYLSLAERERLPCYAPKTMDITQSVT